MLSFLLVPLYTAVMPPGKYGEVQLIFTWFAIFNVVLAYGMETAFFRFFHRNTNTNKVVPTSLLSIVFSTLVFFVLALINRESLAGFLEIEQQHINYVIGILCLDALVIIPFAWLRAKERPLRYATVKIVNVSINLLLNIFFLLILFSLVNANSEGIWAMLYRPDFEITYILMANLIASGVTLIWMSGLYFRFRYHFDWRLWKQMMRYALPIMIAGLAFTVNEVFDRVLLAKMLPETIAKAELGKYAGCYKLAIFMTLFSTAFRLGVEPFFFSHASSENPKRTYAQITTYFVLFGGVILLAVTVYSDILKEILIRDEAYWEAMTIVPIILLANFFLGIYHNLSVWYKITDRTRFGAYISIIGAILTLLINVLFIPAIGYMASAIATLVAYGTMMGLSYYFGRKYYPIPYNMRKIVFYGGFSLLFSVLSFYVFNRNLIAGTLFLFVFLGLIYKLEGEKLGIIFSKRESKNH